MTWLSRFDPRCPPNLENKNGFNVTPNINGINMCLHLERKILNFRKQITTRNKQIEKRCFNTATDVGAESFKMKNNKNVTETIRPYFVVCAPAPQVVI